MSVFHVVACCCAKGRAVTAAAVDAAVAAMAVAVLAALVVAVAVEVGCSFLSLGTRPITCARHESLYALGRSSASQNVTFNCKTCLLYTSDAADE